MGRIEKEESIRKSCNGLLEYKFLYCLYQKLRGSHFYLSNYCQVFIPCDRLVLSFRIAVLNLVENSNR